MKGFGLRVMTVSSVAILLQACGGGSADTPTPSNGTDSEQPSTALEGTWKKECGAADPSNSATHYDIVTTTFTENEFSSNIENFEDSSCTVPLSLSPNPNASGTYVIGGRVNLADGTQGTELDTHIDTYNGAPFKIDEYGIYRIEGDILYLEDNRGYRDGTTLVLRPVTLDYNRPFDRQ